MILLNENNQKYTLFNVSTHFCECAAVQSGHLKSPARTRVNLCKIIFPKNKATIINLMTVVILYANAYSNLKNQDFWCGHLRTDQDTSYPLAINSCSYLWLTQLFQVILCFLSRPTFSFTPF